MEPFREKYSLCGMIYGNTSACTGLLSGFSEGLGAVSQKFKERVALEAVTTLILYRTFIVFY